MLIVRLRGRSYSFKASSNAGDIGECISTIIPGQTFNVAQITYITSGDVVASAWGTSVSTVSAGSYMSAVHLNGWNIAVQTSSSSSSSSLTNSIPSMTSSSSSSGASSPSTGGAPAPGKDEAGRNVGIGVGVSLGTLGILCAVFAVWYVRRRRQPKGNVNVGANNPWEGMGQAPHPGAAYVQPRQEMQSSAKENSRFELDVARK